jgi:hypothetical protein
MKLNSKYIFLIGIVVFLMFSRIESESVIYTGMCNVETVSFLIILVICGFVFYIKKLYKQMKILEIFAVLLIGSFMLYLVFMYCLNLYNTKYYSIDKPVLIEKCEITKISTSRKSRGYYFKFKGTNHFIAGRSEDLKRIEVNPNNFLATVHYKESFFNSYVIVERHIEPSDVRSVP